MTMHPSRDGAAERASDGVFAIATAQEWWSLIGQAPFPHVTQSFAYGDGKAAEGWHVARIGIAHQGRVAAIAQVLTKTIAGMPLARRVNRGPLFLSADPGDEEILAVHRLLRTGQPLALRRPMLVAPALDGTERVDALMRRAGYRRRKGDTWSSGRLDLTRDEDAIIASFAANFRNKIRKSERAGVAPEVATDRGAFDWLVDRHREHMAELKLGYSGDAFFDGLFRSAGDETVLLRIVEDGAPVAALLLVQAGTMMEYNVGWYGEAARRLNAGNILLWAAVREAKRRGCLTLDVGGLLASDDGFSQFKRGLSVDEYTLTGEWVGI